MKNAIIVMLLGTICLSAKKPKPKHQTQPQGYMYCPAGTLYYSDIYYHEDSVTIAAFWIKETEVTNAEYFAFLKDLLDSNFTELYSRCYPDTQLLKRDLWTENRIDYFTNPYFKDHPVVGVTAAQATEYCKWLSKQYIKSNPDFSESFFMIPIKEQWIWAARGGRRYNSYPWGQLTRNSKGCGLANFSDNQMKDNQSSEEASMSSHWYFQWVYSKQWQEQIFLNSEIGKKRKDQIVLWGLPVWADSYFPNDYGLFNMSGNVAEITRVLTDSISHSDSIAYFGGSFRTEARYMNLNWMLPHPFPAPKAQADVGFRPVMTYIPPKIFVN